MDDVKKMSDCYLERVRVEEEEDKEKEIARLEEMIMNENPDTVEAALRIIRNNRPELLREDE